MPDLQRKGGPTSLYPNTAPPTDDASAVSINPVRPWRFARVHHRWDSGSVVEGGRPLRCLGCLHLRGQRLGAILAVSLQGSCGKHSVIRPKGGLHSVRHASRDRQGFRDRLWVRPVGAPHGGVPPASDRAGCRASPALSDRHAPPGTPTAPSVTNRKGTWRWQRNNLRQSRTTRRTGPQCGTSPCRGRRPRKARHPRSPLPESRRKLAARMKRRPRKRCRRRSRP